MQRQIVSYVQLQARYYHYGSVRVRSDICRQQNPRQSEKRGLRDRMCKPTEKIRLQPTRDPHRTHRFSVSALQRRNERSHQYMPHAGLAQTEERGGKSSQETDKTAREADNRGDDPCNAVLCRHVVVTCRAHRKHCARSNKVKVSVKVATNSPGRKKVATTRTGLTLLLVLLARRHVHHGCRLCGRVPRPSADTSPAPTDRANATHGADTLRLSKVLLLLPLRW